MSKSMFVVCLIIFLTILLVPDIQDQVRLLTGAGLLLTLSLLSNKGEKGNIKALNRNIGEEEQSFSSISPIKTIPETKAGRLLVCHIQDIRKQLQIAGLSRIVSDKQSTYSDGFRQGIFYALEKIDLIVDPRLEIINVP